MNIEPPTQQCNDWWEMSRGQPRLKMVLVKGFFEGLELSQSTDAQIQTSAQETVTRVLKLQENIKQVIEHLHQKNSGLASDALAQAACDYTIDNPDTNPLGVMSTEAAVQAFLFGKYLPDPNRPLEDLYHCERVAVSPFVHFRAALYALLLDAEKKPKKVGHFLADFLIKERELIHELMKLRDPDICERLSLH